MSFHIYLFPSDLLGSPYGVNRTCKLGWFFPFALSLHKNYTHELFRSTFAQFKLNILTQIVQVVTVTLWFQGCLTS